MEYEKFCEIILRLKKFQEKKSEAYKLKIDLLEFFEDLEIIISRLISEIYGEQGLEWFDWFCYENDFGNKDWSTTPCYKMVDGKMVKIHETGEVRHGATDENENPICYSIESTWEYLETNHRQNGKNRKRNKK